MAHDVRAIVPIAWTARRIGSMFDDEPHRNDDGLTIEHPTYYFPPKVLTHRYGGFFLRSVQSSVARAIGEFQPEVILSCWAHPDGWAAVRLGRTHGLPVVIKVIGSDVKVAVRRPSRSRRVAEALSGADAVIAVSEDLAQHVIELGVKEDRVRVVPEGVDPELFHPGDAAAARERLGLEDDADRPVRLLFVGNMLMSKGAGVLLEACALLAQRGLRFRCHFVGRGRDETQLKRMARELGVEHVADFAGSCPQPRLADWYRACDLVVLPSFSEGIPNVLREGMMCGRGFVATNVGGIPEITRPGVGILVEPGDVEGLARGIERGLAEGLRCDMAMSQGVNITWSQSAQMVANVLKSSISARKPS